MTDNEEWIVVRHIRRYLHRDAMRGQGTPPWHPTYAKLLSKDEYLSLNAHCRAILHGLWLLYLTSDGRLRLDTSMLTRRLNLRVFTSHIETLVQAGFLEVSASRPPALGTQLRQHDAGLEDSREERSPTGVALLSTEAKRQTPPTDSAQGSVDGSSKPRDPAHGDPDAWFEPTRIDPKNPPRRAHEQPRQRQPATELELAANAVRNTLWQDPHRREHLEQDYPALTPLELETLDNLGAAIAEKASL